MLLIVVADVDVGAQADPALVGRGQFVDDPKDRGLSGPVVADHGHVFSPADAEGDAFKQVLLIKGLGEAFHLHDLAAAFDAGLQDQMHVVPDLEGLFHPFRSGQHLFPALGPFDGFLPVELSELCDDGFLMADLRLVIEPGFFSGFLQVLFLLRIEAVVAREYQGMGVLDLDDLGNGPVQEITVVGYDQDSSLIVGKIGLQPADGSQIQVVGGLVQDDHGRFGKKKFSQSDPGLLTAGKGGNILAVFFFGKAQAPEDTGDLSLVGVAVFHFEPVQQVRIFRHQTDQRLSLQAVHEPFVLGDLLFHVQQILLDGQKLVVDGVLGIQVLVLGQVAEAGIPGKGNGSGIGFHFARNNTDQGGLAGSVHAYDGRLLPFFQMEGDIGQDCIFNECFGYMVTGQNHNDLLWQKCRKRIPTTILMEFFTYVNLGIKDVHLPFS